MTKNWYNFAAYIHHLLAITFYIYNFFVISGGIGFVYAILLYTQTQFTFTIYIISSLSVGSIALGVFLGLSNQKKQLGSYNPALHHKLVENTYTIINDREYIYAKRVEIIPSLQGVDYYRHKFWWKGNGNINPMIKPSLGFIDIYPDKRSPKTVCYLKLNEPLKKSEKTAIEYKLRFSYNNDSPPPPSYFYHSNCSKVDQLKLRVCFPKNVNIKTYKRQIYLNISSDTPLWEEIVKLDYESKEAVFQVSRPRLRYCYKIAWQL